MADCHVEGSEDVLFLALYDSPHADEATPQLECDINLSEIYPALSYNSSLTLADITEVTCSGDCHTLRNYYEPFCPGDLGVSDVDATFSDLDLLMKAAVMR